VSTKAAQKACSISD